MDLTKVYNISNNFAVADLVLFKAIYHAMKKTPRKAIHENALRPHLPEKFSDGEIGLGLTRLSKGGYIDTADSIGKAERFDEMVTVLHLRTKGAKFQPEEVLEARLTKFKSDCFAEEGDKYPKQMIGEFYNWWSEWGPEMIMRWEKEEFFVISKRLYTWKKRQAERQYAR